MDDFNLSCLSEAKNEYSARLVNILTPHITEGVNSIFSEAWNLCYENDEPSKYLMTFQNFLARIPKWNQTIIDEECERILEKSGCGYLEDLITCVHITQLKILTSIRVGTKQKKLELDIPKASDFIHKVYIDLARTLYKNVYLFEKGVSALQMQRYQREIEGMIRESILNAIRQSIPTDHILRAYMDQSTEIEEEVEDYEYGETIDESSKSKSASASASASTSTSKENVASTPDLSNNETESNQKSEKDKSIKGVIKTPSTDTSNNLIKVDHTNTTVMKDISSNDVSNTNSTSTPFNISTNPSTLNTSKSPTLSLSNTPSSPKPSSLKTTPTISNNSSTIEPKKQTLQFNDVDNVLDMNTNKEEKINAPKNVERLEELGKQREQERREEEAEEADDEKLTILGNDDSISLDAEPLEGDKKRGETPIRLDVEELPPVL